MIVNYIGGPPIKFNEAMEHIAKDEWGYSSCYVPGITTTMRKSAVFFTDNKCALYSNGDINKICGIIKVFSVPDNLKTAAAIYKLTFHDEESYTSISEICGKSGLSEKTAKKCVTENLIGYLNEKENEEGLYRFNGAYMNIFPILTLFAF